MLLDIRRGNFLPDAFRSGMVTDHLEREIGEDGQPASQRGASISPDEVSKKSPVRSDGCEDPWETPEAAHFETLHEAFAIKPVKTLRTSSTGDRTSVRLSAMTHAGMMMGILLVQILAAMLLFLGQQLI